MAQYNEHPYSLIWVFATDKRKWNIGGSGLLQKQQTYMKYKVMPNMKYKVMPKKHPTSKVLDQHMHACASAQSDDGLWVFTVEKDLHEIRDGVQETYDQQSSRSVCACASGEFEQDITKTYLYNFDPIKPHFFIVKLGFTGVYIIVLISAQKHRLWVLVRTASARRF